MSLLEQIKSSKSPHEIRDLLNTGDGYRLANARTRRKWQRAAKERNAELRSGQEL